MEAMEAASRHHSKRVSSPARRAPLWAAAFAALALSVPAAAAPASPATMPQSPNAPQKKSSGQAAKPSKPPESAEPAKPAKPGYSPYLASQDVDVGKFYKNKGKYDAAISRFDSAVKHDPGWAVPYELLGETYEKKDDPKRAIAEYRKYLEIKPYAKDAKKIEDRIEKLTQQLKAQQPEGH